MRSEDLIRAELRAMTRSRDEQAGAASRRPRCPGGLEEDHGGGHRRVSGPAPSGDWDRDQFVEVFATRCLRALPSEPRKRTGAPRPLDVGVSTLGIGAAQ